MAIQLDSSGDYLTIAIGASEFDFNSPYTAMFWAKFPVLDAFSTLFMITDSAAQNVDMIHVDNASRLPGLDVKIAGSYDVTKEKGTTQIVDNIWTHFALVRTLIGGSTLGLGIYLNGVLLDGSFDESILSSRTTPASKFNIGAWIDASDHVDNLALYNLKIWSAELTAAEIAAEKDSLDAVRTANLWGVYHMESISDLADATGSHSSITLVGTPTNTASPVLGSTTENVSVSGAVTPAGTATMEVPVKSFLAGSSTGVGVVTRLGMLIDSLKGSTASVGTLSNQQVITTTDRSFASNCSAAGFVQKRTNKLFVGSATGFGQLSNTKLDIISNSGSIGTSGGITNFDMLVDSIHSSVFASSILNSIRIPKPVEVVFASSLVAPNATVKKQANKQLTASSSAVGIASPNVINTELLSVSGTIIPSGNSSYEGIPRSLLDQFFYWLRHHR